MYEFSVNSKIHEIDTFKEFAEAFQLDEQDLIFINKFTYDDFIKAANVPCQFMFYEDYSSGEPSDFVITDMLQDLRKMKIKRIIGIGGGSVLDTAKLLCIKDAESYDDIYDEKIPLVRDKEMVLIPTTCGTGCEMTCVSVVDRPKYHAKMGKRIECNFADHAVLIPELLMKIPHKVFACSAIDATIHALEIFLSPFSGSFAKAYCKEAIRLNIKNFKKIADEGNDAKFEVMNEFLLASAFAGVALSNNVCGAVHACAMHFGGEHHVAHGESNYCFLTAILSTYAELNPEGELLNELVQIIGDNLGIKAGAVETFEALDDLLGKVLPRKHLREYGVLEENIELYVDRVIETQQRLLIASYLTMDKERLLHAYRKAF